MHDLVRNTYRAALILAGTLLAGGCGERTATDATRLATRVQLTVSAASGKSVVATPHTVALQPGSGVIMRATVTDASGKTVPGARPTWRTTNSAVLGTQALPDTMGPGVLVAALAVGKALVIASYEDVADTSTVSVVAAIDSVISNPPPGGYVPPKTFTLKVSVNGSGVGGGSSSSDTLSTPLPGARVTLVLLPPVAGDSLPSGVSPVSQPTTVGTVTADASGVALFNDVPQSRFRLDVVPPSGTTWKATTVTWGVPWVERFTAFVVLTK